MSTEFTVDHEFDFKAVKYLSLAKRRREGMVRVAFNGITVRRSEPKDIDLLCEWLKEEKTYRPLGFARPLRRRDIERSVAPDPPGGMERVEYLVVEDAASRSAFGFLICYELRGGGDAHQEVDLGLSPASPFRGVALVRKIKIALLTYLFTVCGAESVRWIRRKHFVARDQGGDFAGRSGGRAGEGPLHEFSIERFSQLLQRLERDYAPSDMPRVTLVEEAQTQ